MSQAGYEVTLTGQLAPGVSEAQARAGLAGLFKLPEARAAALLAEAPIVIRKNLDETTARKYQAALRQAGLLAEIRAVKTSTAPASGAEVAKSERPSEPQSATPQPLQATIAPTGSLMADPQEVAPLEVDLSGLSLAEAGARIGDSLETPPLKVDLTGLTLAEPGARLDKDPSSGDGGTPAA